CREAAWKNALIAPRFKDLIPELLGIPGIGIDLKTVFARVAGPRDDSLDTVDLAGREVVLLDRSQLRFGQLLQNPESLWALDSDLAVVCARVSQGNTGLAVFRIAILFAADGRIGVLRYPLPILIGRSCVDDEKKLILKEPINEQVVHNPALFVRQDRVMSLAIDKFRHIVC